MSQRSWIKNIYSYISIFFIFLLISPQNLAQESQSLESIHSTVKNFIRSNFKRSDSIKIKVGLNDQRLRLAKCNKSLTVAWNNQHKRIGNTSVTVQCHNKAGWKIFVPVYIKQNKAVLVARHTLLRGQALSREDFQLEQRDISKLSNGYITQPQKYLGFSIKRQINAGQIILPNALKQPKLVHRGERVVLLANLEGIQVRSQGVALQDGNKGQTIQIRNSSSQRIIEGRVVSAGLVRITL